jgi:membrane-associated phospholipid phosphatase
MPALADPRGNAAAFLLPFISTDGRPRHPTKSARPLRAWTLHAQGRQSPTLRRGREMGRIATICRITTVLLLVPFSWMAYPMDASSVGGQVGADARWVAKITWWDVRSIAALPLAITHVRDITWHQVLSGAIAVGAIGATIGLDPDIRRGAKDIGHNTARDIQDVATTVSWASLGGLYAAGLWEQRDDWRHNAITGGEGALVSMGLTKATKAAFGRQRPDSGDGAYSWFAGGTSFVSDAATPHFAVSEAVSQSFDHAWWAMLPSYAVATAVGVGRMGQDRHWASDIVGSAALGFGSERLFSFFHDEEERQEKSTPVVSIQPQGHGLSLNVSWRF